MTERKVRGVMSAPPVTVNTDTAIVEAAPLMDMRRAAAAASGLGKVPPRPLALAGAGRVHGTNTPANGEGHDPLSTVTVSDPAGAGTSSFGWGAVTSARSGAAGLRVHRGSVRSGAGRGCVSGRSGGPG